MGISFLIDVHIFHERNYSAKQELDDRHRTRISWFSYWQWARELPFPETPYGLWDTTSLLLHDYWWIFPSGPEFHHSHTSSEEVNNERSCTYTIPYILKVWCLSIWKSAVWIWDETADAMHRDIRHSIYTQVRHKEFSAIPQWNINTFPHKSDRFNIIASSGPNITTSPHIRCAIDTDEEKTSRY